MQRHLLLLLLALLPSLWLPGRAFCAPALPATEALPAFTVEQINSKINELESSTGLDAELKKRVIEVYRKAQTQLQKAQTYTAAAASYKQAIQTAPPQTKEIQQQLDQPSLPPPDIASLGIGESVPLSEIKQQLTKEKADKAALAAKLSELEKKLQDEKDRPGAIQTRLQEVKHLQERLATEAKTPVPADQAPELTKALEVLAPIREQALNAEVHMLDQELLSQAARVALLRAQQEKTSRSLSNVSARVKLLEALANERRHSEAKQEQARAIEMQQQMAGKHPLIAAIAEKNTKLSKQLADLTTRLDGVTEKTEEANQAAKQIENDLKSAKQKLKIAGLSQVLGSFLVEQRNKLNRLLDNARDAEGQGQLIGEAGLQQLQLAEKRRALTNLDAALKQRMEKSATQQLSPQLRQEARGLLKSYRETLDKTIDTYDTYLRQLSELDFAQRRLYDAARGYSEFLDEHLLWTPNTNPVGVETFTSLPSALGWLFAPGRWWQATKQLARAAATPQGVLILVLFGLLLSAKPRIRGALMKTGEQVRNPATDRFGLTVQALGWTVLLAVPWPLLLVLAGSWLEQIPTGDEFSRAIGNGLTIIGGTLLHLRLLQLFCIPGGVADRHFRWSAQTLEAFRRQIRWLIVVALPAAFVASSTAADIKAASTMGLSWLGFVITMAALAVLFHRIFQPQSGILAHYYRSASSRWLARLRYLWYLLAITTPLGLAGLASVGYYYTAGVLTLNVVNTLWLLLGIIIVHSLVVRWLLLTRLRLARRLAREKREAEQAALDHPEAGGFTEESQEREEIDLEGMDTQTRELVNVFMVFVAAIGLWSIWAEVIPALSILDKVSLWHFSEVVDGQTQHIPVTLADVGLAIVLAIVTAVATKNIPGLLEIILLQRLSMQPGTRYAVISLVSYTILSLGIIAVFAALGGRWSQIQWLVAAVSVGLGFGLQEIFGNFVSGLIILFERPIRVGDIVTVGDTTGAVTRIRIRATVITNWDKQELLVPNKEFITGRLLNWTLSNQMNRIVISVGIAYGSDVGQALKLLSEAAGEHQHILDDPAPMITFEGFADSSLTLILRCYLESMEFRLSTISELHQAINRKFNQAGVVIAFPQQDVHLDTSKPLDIRIQSLDGWPPKPATGHGGQTDAPAPSPG